MRGKPVSYELVYACLPNTFTLVKRKLCLFCLLEVLVICKSVGDSIGFYSELWLLPILASVIMFASGLE